ncbi:YceD family protein [Gorillibacterium massiliense]|uniref:YceD family protein n=1 Tax=Gorillibacterium massiliense TaxID=1280390 RepID=UPI0004B8972B|nr:DUF177 domain-containing protein [Gorillibacterium massiliense]
MIINMKDLAVKDHAVRVSESVDLTDFLSGRQDLTSFGEVNADLTATFAFPTVVVEGTLTIPVTMVCSRCLGDVQDVLRIPFRERFTREAPAPDEEEAEDLHLVSEDEVDLKPYVEEAVWMAIPYIPLCSETCKGLCPDCGTNRNERDCGCRQETIDPRLAGLADFFK